MQMQKIREEAQAMMDIPTPPNAFEHEIVGQCQTLYCNALKVDDVVDIELVDYFNSPVIQEGNGFYHVFYAIARQDYPHCKIRNGDALMFHVAYRMLVNALAELPLEYKISMSKKYSEGKNLFWKICKLNSKAVRIDYAEPREPTEENISNANKFYSIIKSLNKR